MKKRRKGREMALEILYQIDLGGSEAREALARYDPVERHAARVEESGEPDPVDAADLHAAFEYAGRLVEGTLARQEEIDDLIVSQAENWRLERMPAVDRNVLRLAVYELLEETEVPKVVVLDEAIELSKAYGSEQSGAFVNGLLDGLLKRHRFPGRMT
ncbi:MAG: transcription antitermination factor NusB [Thermoanaerobaculia bacterium]